MTKSFKEMQGIKEACWVGYKQVGMKKKGDRMVPNCVKEEVVDAVFGKDYVYQENYQDMYKGKLNKNQIATIKNTWAGKKASDVTQGVRDMVKNMDQFTRMDIKKANIKHISALINDEYDFALPLSDLIEMQEFNAAVRHTELKEFTDEQISKLAKSYADLAGKTMSIQNANKLRKLFDRIPDSSLNKLRKKKIPFISGLALSRMIQKKIPVNESAYNDESAWEVSGVENEGREELQEARWHIEGTMGYKGIGGQDGFEMVINAPNESAAEDKAYKELDKARDRKKIGPGGGGSVEDVEIEGIERTTDKLSPPETFRGLNSFDPSLKEAKFTIEYEVESDSRADDKYVGEDEITINASSSKDAAKKFGERMNKLVKQAGQRSKSILKINMTSFEDDNRNYNDSEINKLDDHANDIIYKNIRNSYTEADLSKSQIKKVHKQADDLPKKDFMKRYGKDGDSVRYATATNMVKKKLGLGESNFIKKGELKMNDTYKQRLTSAMEHFNISSLGELNEDDHKTFFSYVDDMKEGLSAAQKKLPPALQKAIAAKMKDKKEVKEDLVGGQKKLDKDKDGDIDGKDFAKLRSMKKEYGTGNMMASKKSTLSMPIKPASKMKKEEKTKETDLEPNVKKLNAMVKDPHKSHKGNPIDDMNAGYMKSDVKAPVKDGGGADMAKVKDKPVAQEPMKKINAMYKENHRYLQTKPGSLEEAVLKSRGLIKK